MRRWGGQFRLRRGQRAFQIVAAACNAFVVCLTNADMTRQKITVRFIVQWLVL